MPYLLILALLLAPQFKPEKNENKKPMQIEIRATVDKIKSALMRSYVSDGWRVEKESESTVVFTSPRGNLATNMAYGIPSCFEDRFTFLKSDAATTVVADLGVLSGPEGRQERHDWNREKKLRERVAATLKKIKEQVE